VAETLPVARSWPRASHILGGKLDSIPFSPYHLMLIAVLALIGFVDGYDLVMTGSLLVLAKQPLHLTPTEIRYLAVASTMMVCVGGFLASMVSDHWSRKIIHADRRRRVDLVHSADHAGADCRAAHRSPSGDRSLRWTTLAAKPTSPSKRGRIRWRS
jgi:hypothetical protein